MSLYCVYRKLCASFLNWQNLVDIILELYIIVPNGNNYAQFGMVEK
jgi:hypothetical protein